MADKSNNEDEENEDNENNLSLGLLNKDISSSNSSESVAEMPSSSSSSMRIYYWFGSLSDAIPRSWLLYKVITNGKLTAACLLGVYVVLLILIVVILWPIRFVSETVSKLLGFPKSGGEIMTVLLILLLIRCLGRMILQYLVFPGASQRLCVDIATDFATYSVRLLNNVADAALALVKEIRTNQQNKKKNHNIISHMDRVLRYRTRVLVVYRDVLNCLLNNINNDDALTDLIFEEEEELDDDDDEVTLRTTEHGQTTSYGTNRFHGDIEPLFPFFLLSTNRNQKIHASYSNSPLKKLTQTIIQQLSNIISDLDSIEAQLMTANSQVTLTSTVASLSAHCSSLKNTLNTQLLSTTTKQEGQETVETIPETNRPGKVWSNITSFFLALLDPLYYYYDHQRQKTYSHNNSTIIQASDVFTMDVMRGCFLSRYQGAQQFWIPRQILQSHTNKNSKNRSNGFLDCIVIPPPPPLQSNTNKNPNKAVIYCNPNAGLYEVATGMNVMGGNIHGSSTSEQRQQQQQESTTTNNWTDFYLKEGYYVILFNYAGYGRSYGVHHSSITATSSSSPRQTASGWKSIVNEWFLQTRVRRICFSILFGWTATSTSRWAPSPESLKADGLTLATFLINAAEKIIRGEGPLEKIVIHGESIGGMVAASTARNLSSRTVHSGTSNNSTPEILLVCDRTFCNLIATAQRLVGGWSGPAIRMLVPFWNTNVAADFQAVQCPKVVANDPADAIIADPSSLRSGLAVASELQVRNSFIIGTPWDAPVSHRMAEWENVGLYESRFSRAAAKSISAPLWPKDHHFTVKEAFHFAACVRRIANLAKSAAAASVVSSSSDEESSEKYSQGSTGIELSLGFFPEEDTTSIGGDTPDERNETTTSPLIVASSQLSQEKNNNLPAVATIFVLDVWKILSSCDGLYGATLGDALLGGCADNIVTWLCSTVVFGCQTLVLSMERRMRSSSSNSMVNYNTGSDNNNNNNNNTRVCVAKKVETADFSAHKRTTVKQESFFSLPIPEVISSLKTKIDSCNSNDKGFIAIERELKYCIDILEYIVSRISSPQVLERSWQNLHFLPLTDINYTTGSFFRLHCGHNNHFSAEEKEYFKILLSESHNYYLDPINNCGQSAVL